MTSEERTMILYPAYINSNRTLAKGRRLTREKCVTDPRCTEIRDVLEANKLFRVTLEPNKVYPRESDKESAVFRGRVAVSVSYFYIKLLDCKLLFFLASKG